MEDCLGSGFGVVIVIGLVIAAIYWAVKLLLMLLAGIWAVIIAISVNLVSGVDWVLCLASGMHPAVAWALVGAAVALIWGIREAFRIYHFKQWLPVLAFVPLVVVVLVRFAVGVTVPADRAGVLLEKGEYEQLIAQFGSDSSAARSVRTARDTLAARLFAAGEYQKIVEAWAGTSVAPAARDCVATRLLRAGNLTEAAAKFADTPSGATARNRIADDHLKRGNVDLVLREYMQTPAGAKAVQSVRRLFRPGSVWEGRIAYDPQFKRPGEQLHIKITSAKGLSFTGVSSYGNSGNYTCSVNFSGSFKDSNHFIFVNNQRVTGNCMIPCTYDGSALASSLNGRWSCPSFSGTFELMLRKGQKAEAEGALISSDSTVSGQQASVLDSAATGEQESGATQEAAAGNNVLVLGGSGSYVSIPHISPYDLRSSMTIEAWVYLKSYGDWRGVVTKGTQWGVYSMRLAKHRINFYLNDGRSDRCSASSNREIPLKQWHHWAVTYDQGAMKVYVDGELDGSVTCTKPIHNNSEALILGADLPEGDEYLHGEIDDVCLWSVVRSAEEIKQDMTGMPTGSNKNVVGLWRFDDDTDSGVAVDGSRFKNIGRGHRAQITAPQATRPVNLRAANPITSPTK